MVCHVLRYTAAFAKIRALLDQRTLGDLVMIDHIEQVGFRHDAHSYVRGNWRKAKETAPMILAKSCHDMDLLQYFAQSRCTSISSVGELTHFKTENRPQEARDRCLECPLQETCPYSAKLIYLEGFRKSADPQGWPFNVLATGFLTEDILTKALMEGPYGRCVYACDNDVVDHQAALITFENGVKATFRMTAFTKYGGRQIKFYLTKGELELDETAGEIRIRPFQGTDSVLRIAELSPGTSGHGGGDDRMIDALYHHLSAKTAQVDTTLENSIDSHLMAFAAEKSRIHGGKRIQMSRKKR
jgi:predicted dehydrogenase